MDRPSPTRPSRRRLAPLLFGAGALLLPLALAPAGAGGTTRGANCVIDLVDDAYQTPQGVALTVPDPGVVTNDGICGTNGLVISVSQPAHGTLSDFDDSSGGFTYTPDPGFTGVDSFTYTLEDVPDIFAAKVSITVTEPTTESSVPTTSTTTGSTSTTAGSTTTTSPAAQAVTATATFTG